MFRNGKKNVKHDESKGKILHFVKHDESKGKILHF